MGRAGRYTLSVMAWVAAYAGWSSLVGLLIAAATGDRPRHVSAATSALFTVVGPIVPTLVALWFNDWARDGFPTKEQRRDGSSGASAGLAPLRSSSRPTEAPDEPETLPEPEALPAGFPVAPLLRDRVD